MLMLFVGDTALMDYKLRSGEEILRMGKQVQAEREKGLAAAPSDHHHDCCSQPDCTNSLFLASRRTLSNCCSCNGNSYCHNPNPNPSSDISSNADGYSCGGKPCPNPSPSPSSDRSCGSLLYSDQKSSGCNSSFNSNPSPSPDPNLNPSPSPSADPSPSPSPSADPSPSPSPSASRSHEHFLNNPSSILSPDGSQGSLLFNLSPTPSPDRSHGSLQFNPNSNPNPSSRPSPDRSHGCLLFNPRPSPNPNPNPDRTYRSLLFSPNPNPNPSYSPDRSHGSSLLNPDPSPKPNRKSRSPNCDPNPFPDENCGSHGDSSNPSPICRGHIHTQGALLCTNGNSCCLSPEHSQGALFCTNRNSCCLSPEHSETCRTLSAFQKTLLTRKAVLGEQNNLLSHYNDGKFSHLSPDLRHRIHQFLATEAQLNIPSSSSSLSSLLSPSLSSSVALVLEDAQIVSELLSDETQEQTSPLLPYHPIHSPFSPRPLFLRLRWQPTTETEELSESQPSVKKNKVAKKKKTKQSAEQNISSIPTVDTEPLKTETVPNLCIETKKTEAEKSAELFIEQPAELSVKQPVEQIVEQSTELSVKQLVEQIVEQSTEQSAEQPVKQSVEQIVEQSVPVKKCYYTCNYHCCTMFALLLVLAAALMANNQLSIYQNTTTLYIWPFSGGNMASQNSFWAIMQTEKISDTLLQTGKMIINYIVKWYLNFLSEEEQKERETAFSRGIMTSHTSIRTELQQEKISDTLLQTGKRIITCMVNWCLNNLFGKEQGERETQIEWDKQICKAKFIPAETDTDFYWINGTLVIRPLTDFFMTKIAESSVYERENSAKSEEGRGHIINKLLENKHQPDKIIDDSSSLPLPVVVSDDFLVSIYDSISVGSADNDEVVTKNDIEPEGEVTMVSLNDFLTSFFDSKISRSLHENPLFTENKHQGSVLMKNNIGKEDLSALIYSSNFNNESPHGYPLISTDKDHQASVSLKSDREEEDLSASIFDSISINRYPQENSLISTNNDNQASFTVINEREEEEGTWNNEKSSPVDSDNNHQASVELKKDNVEKEDLIIDFASARLQIGSNLEGNGDFLGSFVQMVLILFFAVVATATISYSSPLGQFLFLRASSCINYVDLQRTFKAEREERKQRSLLITTEGPSDSQILSPALKTEPYASPLSTELGRYTDFVESPSYNGIKKLTPVRRSSRIRTRNLSPAGIHRVVD